VKRDWEKWGGRVKLVVLASPYRSLMEPLLEYIEQVENERANDYVTVILPEFVPARWWQHLLHNQRALLIKGALLFRPTSSSPACRSTSSNSQVAFATQSAYLR
jgi:hypothetical protein